MAQGAGIAGAVGQLYNGRQARQDIDSQRKIEQFNIKAQEQNLALTGQQTSAREEAQRRASRYALGAQRGAIAQTGVGFDGSSADIIRQSTTAAELDSLNIRYAGDLERLSILNDISMRKYTDAQLKIEGKKAMRLRWAKAAGAFFGASPQPLKGDVPRDGTPRTTTAAYGQGSRSSFGNNMGNFTSSGAGTGGSSGFTGGGLTGGYGSIGGYSGIFGGGG